MNQSITTVNRKDKTEQWKSVLNELYDKFQDHGQQAVKNYDDEAIHQARVNCRKLMTLMRILDPEQQTGLLPIFKKAQKRLGKVRDADVLIDAFKDRRKQSKEQGLDDEAALLKAAIEEHKEQRQFYRKKMVKKLPKLQGKKLKRQWQEFTENRLPDLAVRADVNRMMRELEISYEQKKQTYRQTAKAEGLESAETLDSLHKVRIAAKELRYTAEAAEFALNSKFRDHEETYKRIQKELGTINDTHVWIESLEELDAKEMGVDEKVRARFVDKLRTEMIAAIEEQQRAI
ncbi:CHAD domain-containing protein [Paenibacillus sp. Z6-24]